MCCHLALGKIGVGECCMRPGCHQAKGEPS